MSEGYIFLHRKTQKHWVFERSEYLKAWIQMLFDATHQDYEVLVGNQLVRLKRGSIYLRKEGFFQENWPVREIGKNADKSAQKEPDDRPANDE